MIILALLALVAIVPEIRADAVPQSNVIAHASDDTLWVAQVLAAPEIKPSGEKTAIRYRALNNADQSWHELPTQPGRVVQIANRGQTAAILMKSGEWMLLWPDGSSMGPLLPKRERMIALASERDRNTIFAIGIPSEQATTDSSEFPSTERSSTSQPQINPDKAILYAFEGANWKALANCPDAVIAAPDQISLAVVARNPMIAQEEASGAIHVYLLDEESKWIDRGIVKPPESAFSFRLLSGTLRPTLWVGDKTSGGLLYLGGEKWVEPVKLALSRQMSPVNGCLVAAAGALRLFITDDKGKLYEQRFEGNGNRIGDLAALPAPMPLLPPGYDNWPMFIVLGAVALMMLSSARRRSVEDAKDKEPGEMVLASSGQRLTAGLIDGVPIILGILYIINHQQNLVDASDITWTWLIPVFVAIVIYLLHTTLSELISGRTIGKIIVGLQVVAVNGKPPGAGAIVIRNLLRLIDVFPVPLALLIVTSPMKQRLGDLLAGTVVIIAPRAQSEDDDRSSSADS